jgi:hypothetical protein
LEGVKSPPFFYAFFVPFFTGGFGGRGAIAVFIPPFPFMPHDFIALALSLQYFRLADSIGCS